MVIEGVTLVKGVMVVEGAGGSAGGSCLIGIAVETVRGELLCGNDGSTFTGSSGGVGSSLILMEGGLTSMATSAVACSAASIFSSRRAFFFSLMAVSVNTRQITSIPSQLMNYIARSFLFSWQTNDS